MLIELDNRTSLPLELSSLEKIASFLTDRSIELIITGNEEIQELNLAYRGRECSTDVLSFPLEASFQGTDSEHLPLGSVVISEHYVRDKAKAFSHSVQDELSLLFIHGLLHLLGYDHEDDEGEMRRKEQELIHTFGLPKSLIVRTTEKGTE